MTREQAEEILKRDMPLDTTVSLTVREDGRGRIAIKSKDIDESRSFNLVDHALHSGCMELNSDGAKGKGLGRHIMRNEIEFFRACGVKKFNIYAALTNGGYTWARLGFVPESTAGFAGTVKTRVEKLSPLLTTEEKETLADIAKFRSTKDIWRLADLKVDMRERLTSVFKKAAEGDVQARYLTSAIEDMNGDIETQLRSKKELMIGRLLLTGTSWDGNLFFDDKEQMARVENYVGGWIGIPGAQQPPEAMNDNDPKNSVQTTPEARRSQAATFTKVAEFVDRCLIRLGL
ncbi:MAG TPA: hypothetical protein VL625_11315 [Patescibacteria group bacterium]|nr:hypothetical protein [Patescibacteria group bacterium]